MNRRGFLRLFGLGVAAVAAPTKTFAFFGNIYRPPAPQILTLVDVCRRMDMTGATANIAEILGMRYPLLDNLPWLGEISLV